MAEHKGGKWPIPVQAAILLRLFGLLLLANFLMRGLFVGYNHNALPSNEIPQVFLAFLVGIRFDLATICILNAPFLLLLALPWKPVLRLRIQRWLMPILWFFNAIILFLNGVDIAYFSTSSKRLSHELFSASKDLGSFDTSVFAIYAGLFLFWAALSFGLWWALRRQMKHPGPSTGNKWLNWSFTILVLGLMTLAIRGGLQHKPLRPADAFVSTSYFAGNVGLNTAYSVISSIDIGREEPVNFMPDSQALDIVHQLYKNDFDGKFDNPEFPLLRSTHFPGPEKRHNVVILILESFNANRTGVLNPAVGPNATPNFDAISKEGLLFRNFYSNGSRSVQALPAILNSVPEIFSRPSIGSSYETNNTFGIAKMLKKRGYETAFFCGGPNGTMGFDVYGRLSGIEQYYGRNEFPDSKTENSTNWGIHDGPFLNWVADVQKNPQGPFLHIWFSISNHFPFAKALDCPEEIAKTKSGVELTMAYTDHVLGQYFQKVRQYPWFSDTYFLITGDHCHYGPDEPNRPMMDNFHVPLLILGPGITPGQSELLGSHLDIVPTLIELLQLQTKHASAGISLLSKTNFPCAVNNLMETLTLGRKDHSWSTNFSQVQSCFSLEAGRWNGLEEAKWDEVGLNFNFDQAIRAIYQVSHQARLQNKVFPYEY